MNSATTFVTWISTTANTISCAFSTYRKQHHRILAVGSYPSPLLAVDVLLVKMENWKILKSWMAAATLAVG